MPARRAPGRPGLGRDRRVDEQRLPAPRRPHVGPLGGQKLIARRGLSPGRSLGRGLQPFDHVEQRQLARRQRLVARGDQRRRIRRRAAGRGVAPRHLAERQVFGEAPRRQVVGGAGEQREEGPAGRIRAPRAAREPGRHLGALERLFDRAPVAFGRADDDRHLVERHAARRFVEDPPRDLDRLARFARRREEPDAVVGSTPAGASPANRKRRTRASASVPPSVAPHRRHAASGGGSSASVRASPAGIVASTAEALATSAATNACSATVAIGTSSEDDRPRRQAARVAGAEARGRRLEQRRAVGEPALRQQGGVAMRRDGRGPVRPPRGPPAAPARRRPRAARPACRPGRAAGPGCRRSGPDSRASRPGSARRGRGWPARRLASAVAGVTPAAARVAVAIRDASWPRVKRCRPKVAPRVTATPRQKSSAASRVAPTTRTSVAAGQSATNAAAASSRTRADADTTARDATVPLHYRRKMPVQVDAAARNVAARVAADMVG